MIGAIKIPLLIVSFFSFAKLQAQERDTVMYQHDSVITLPTAATVLFFQEAEKPADPAKTMVINKAGKTVSLSSLLKPMNNPDLALTDLDNDGKKELLVYQFTDAMSGIFNSANDEIWIYRNTANNKYQYAGKLIKGSTRFTSANEFVYSFHAYLGNFLSCNDCVFSDTADDAPIPVHEITLKYNKGKLAAIKGDQELRSMINDNLGKFGERATPIVKDQPENGIRKEIAMNLAVYYYSFGKNLPETQRLFYKYYKLPDAKKIWATFANAIKQISTQNSF